MKTTATETQLRKALQTVNKQRGYKLRFNRFDRKGKYVNFTIETDSKIPGARKSHSGRNLPKASWHAHGFLFEEILKLNKESVIISKGTKKITINGGNWEDSNIGSMFKPCYFSETSILSGKE